MKRLRLSAIFMLLQGGILELGAALMLIPILIMGSDMWSFFGNDICAEDIKQYLVFNVPYLKENLNQVLIMAGIFGAIRIVGAIGVLRNKLWGLAVSTIMAVITLALSIIVLPAGVAEGVLSGVSLILMLTVYFGKRNITEKKIKEDIELL